MHLDEWVNDSTNLSWNGKWVGDQLFVSISNRLAENMYGWYDGNTPRAPDGPYHFWILGDQVTLNGGDTTYVPEEIRGCYGDSLMVFEASDICEWATSIDVETGIWNVEMKIFNPSVAAQSAIGFNVGGSVGSDQATAQFGDAYAYYTWQPNIPDDPFGDPFGNGDPGFFNLANSEYWAVLNFVSGVTGVREEKLSETLPSNYDISQNYPNPFNPSTTIQFALPQKSDVTVSVYNTIGQLVETLISNKTYSPGKYSVEWNAAGLSSGVYFYTLKAGDMQITKKMILLK